MPLKLFDIKDSAKQIIEKTLRHWEAFKSAGTLLDLNVNF